MALDFPSSPTNGQLYTSNGRSWSWDASANAWLSASVMTNVGMASISTDPPSNPVNGDLWWDSDDGILRIYYADGTSNAWVDAMASGASVWTANMSLIVNTLTVTATSNLAGNVGIGNTGAYSNATLHVNHSGGTADIAVGKDTKASANAENGLRLGTWTDGNQYIDSKTFANGYTRFRTGGGAEIGAVRTWMEVYSNTGAVGIGGSPKSARYQQRLEVMGYETYGGAAFGTYSAGAGDHCSLLDINRSANSTLGSHTAVSTGYNLGIIAFRGSDGNSFITAASIGTYADGTTGVNDMPGRMIFSTTADGANSASERMRISSTGNVGIGGATSPSGQLHVRNLNTTYDAPARCLTLEHALATNATHTSDAAGARIAFKGTDTDGNNPDIAYIDGLMIDPNYDTIGRSGAIVFSTIRTWTGANYPVERMRIDYDGVVTVNGALSTGQFRAKVQALSTAAAQNADVAVANDTTILNISPTGSDGPWFTGLAGGYDGRIVAVHNSHATYTLKFANDSANSTTANRLYVPGTELWLGPRRTYIFFYDGTASRWRILN